MNGDKSSEGPNVVPLRTILRNFLNLVENYEARRNGGLDSYESEFQELKQLSESLKSDPGHYCREGEKNLNRKKNRYKDILPYDFSRVILNDVGDVPGSDYINANFIKGASGSSAYIACQGPLPHTVNDFWRMVVECEVQVIVMACNEQESGKHKCENYWVEDDGVEREFGDVVVWLKKCRQVCPDFLVRTMRMRYKNNRGETEERNVCQFHYSAWPDHGVPTKVRPLLDMVRLIRDCQTSETLPVLVHCSAGCGRTGTICAIDYVWGLLRLGRLTAEFSLFNLVREMRKQRIAMVQTKDQYILVHRAVKELFQEQLKIIDSHPYANVDEDGLPLELKSELMEPTYELLNSQNIKNDPSGFSSSPGNCSTSSVEQSNGIIVSVSNVNVISNAGANATPANSFPQKAAFGVNSVSFGSSDSNPMPLPARPSKLNGSSEPVVISRDKSLKVDKKKEESQDPPDLIVSEIHDVNGYDAKSDRESSPSTSSENRKVFSKPTNSYAALLRKPSIVKFKSLFEKATTKEEGKDGKTTQVLPKLSRAKSDVSTRFQAFTASFTSRSPPPNLSSANDSKGSKTSPKPKMEDKNYDTGDEASSLHYNKDGRLSHVKSSVKRSKSLKITTDALSKLSPFKTESKSSKVRTSSSASKSSSAASGLSAVVAEDPIKVCVKQVEMPKLQSVIAKSVKPETQKAETNKNEQEYDYDIDDRSHLRQQPISSTALEREPVLNSSGGSQDYLNRGSSHSFLNEPRPSSKSMVRLDATTHDYVNTSIRNRNNAAAPEVWAHGKSFKTGISKEMEDISNIRHGNSKTDAYGRIKKSDTVNARMISSTKGFGSHLEFANHEKLGSPYSQTFSSKTNNTKEPKFTLLFSSSKSNHEMEPKDNLKAVTAGSSNQLMKTEELIPAHNITRRIESNSPHDPDNIYIEAINSDIQVTKSLSTSAADPTAKSNPPEGSGSANASSEKPLVRRRVPKTNPYANYPSCVTGTAKFPSKVAPDRSKTFEMANQLVLPLHPESSTRFARENGTNLPNLKPSSGSGSVGNSSNSSSSTPTPRNSLPGTPTQSVDILYPSIFQRGAAGPAQTGSTITSINARPIGLRQNPLPNKQNPRPKAIMRDGVEDGSYKAESPSPNSKPSQILSSVLNPKISTIRIAVGVRERRNSFRQAVWKEAQPSNGVFDGPNHGATNGSSYDADLPSSSNPNHQSKFSISDLIPPVSAKNYEPIWPGQTSASSSRYDKNQRGLHMKSSDYVNNASSGQTEQNGGGYHGSNQQDPTFQAKVDEIKNMLVELNAPKKSSLQRGASASKLGHVGNSVTGSTSSLKQHRSLRAPSRSQYQQGLSCFTFKKPSSYESVVDAIQLEDDKMLLEATSMVPQNHGDFGYSPAYKPETEFLGQRLSNEYVTLNQCRSPDGRNNESPSTSNSRQTSSSPESLRKNRKSWIDNTGVPIPPPRAKKNNASQDLTREKPQLEEWTPWNQGYKPLRNPHENSFAPEPNFSRTEIPGGNSSASYGNSQSSLSTNSYVNHEDDASKNLSSSSPKAIIRALGLFQAKAANVRTRLASWAEARDNSKISPKDSKAVSNGMLGATDPETYTRMHNNADKGKIEEDGFLHSYSLQESQDRGASFGTTSLSKHQYL